jgi:hypothetical protein
MPITPAPPYPKSPGDAIQSADWNQAVDEVIRLDNAKLDQAGGQISGDLEVAGNLSVVTGNLSVGVAPPEARVHLFGGQWDVSNTEGDLKIGDATNRLKIGVATGGGGAGDVRIRAVGGTNRLMLGGGANDTLVVTNTNVTVQGDLRVPNTGGGFAYFTNFAFTNENQFPANNVKLSMGAAGLIVGGPQLAYAFTIGHTFFSLGIPGGGGTSFVPRFSINQNGDLFVSGAKGGYVVDHFVNRAGDTLSRGDVVVIGRKGGVQFSGTDNNIPIPEVDLTDQAYDTRVCGIVASVVSEPDLPFVEPDREALAKLQAEAETVDEKDAAAVKAFNKKTQKLFANPLQKFAAAATGDLDRTAVQDRQMGQMVTLGTFAHCKVDADIAPIEPGDLLTTSPTRGHAQKVLEPQKAIGAVIGKALTGLKKGKGTIPVLVMMQ